MAPTMKPKPSRALHALEVNIGRIPQRPPTSRLPPPLPAASRISSGSYTASRRSSTQSTEDAASSDADFSVQETRMLMEYRSLRGSAPLGVYVLPSQSSMFVWNGVIFVHALAHGDASPGNPLSGNKDRETSGATSCTAGGDSGNGLSVNALRGDDPQHGLDLGSTGSGSERNVESDLPAMTIAGSAALPESTTPAPLPPASLFSSPFHGAVVEFVIIFPPTFPQSPPTLRFKTPVPHPQISPAGDCPLPPHVTRKPHGTALRLLQHVRALFTVSWAQGCEAAVEARRGLASAQEEQQRGGAGAAGAAGSAAAERPPAALAPKREPAPSKVQLGKQNPPSEMAGAALAGRCREPGASAPESSEGKGDATQEAGAEARTANADALCSTAPAATVASAATAAAVAHAAAAATSASAPAPAPQPGGTPNTGTSSNGSSTGSGTGSGSACSTLLPAIVALNEELFEAQVRRAVQVSQEQAEERSQRRTGLWGAAAGAMAGRARRGGRGAGEGQEHAAGAGGRGGEGVKRESAGQAGERRVSNVERAGEGRGAEEEARKRVVQAVLAKQRGRDLWKVVDSANAQMA